MPERPFSSCPSHATAPPSGRQRVRPQTTPGVRLGQADPDVERHDGVVGRLEDLEGSLGRVAGQREEDVAAVRRDGGPEIAPAKTLRGPGSVRLHLPDAGLVVRIRAVVDPRAVRRHGRVLRVDAVVRDLSRVRPVRVGHPDLEVPAPSRAPEKVLAVRRESRIPVFQRVLGQPAYGACRDDHLPDVEVAAAVRRVDDARAVGREGGLAVDAVAAREPARRAGAARLRVEGDLEQILAARERVEEQAAGRAARREGPR